MSSTTPAGRPSAHGLLKRLLPMRVYVFVREIFMALFTPTAHAAKRGYFRSALTRSVKGGKNSPTPWMTFPLVSYLESRSFTDRTVLEFGSGASTAWWALRAEHVTALETDPEWLSKIRSTAPANVDVVAAEAAPATQEDFDKEVRSIVGDSTFDVVVVDGGDRVKALNLAIDLVTPDGIIIVDDLDLFDAEPEWRAALDPWFDRGFERVDFMGMAIAAPFTRDARCTSLFFRPGSFLTTQRHRLG